MGEKTRLISSKENGSNIWQGQRDKVNANFYGVSSRSAERTRRSDKLCLLRDGAAKLTELV